MTADMSSPPDAETLAKALEEHDEVREQLAAEIAAQMHVDTDTPEGDAAAAYRRDVLKALGAVGVGGAVGYGAAESATQPAAASHGGGSVGTPANPVDVHANLVSTEQAKLGTVSDEGDIYRLIERQEPSSSTSSVLFSGLDSDTVYKLWYSVSLGGDVGLSIRLNGDGGGNGNYDYWDETGTLQTGNDGFVLADISNGTPLSGQVYINQTEFGTADERIGINHQLLPGNTSRITGFGREGARNEFGDGLSSIEIRSQDGDSDINTESVVELWERDYA